MSSNTKKKSNIGKRYTDAEKQEVISFVEKVNAENGRGGQSLAAKKFGISVITVAAWLRSKAAGKAAASSKAGKVAAKPAKKTTKKKSPQGKRYSDEQKKQVVDFVVDVNTNKGRGGLSAATKKFRISPLTISSWIKKSGVKMPKLAKTAKTAKPAKAAKAAKPAKAAPANDGARSKTMLAIGNQIAKAEQVLAKLKVMLGAIK